MICALPEGCGEGSGTLTNLERCMIKHNLFFAILAAGLLLIVGGAQAAEKPLGIDWRCAGGVGAAKTASLARAFAARGSDSALSPIDVFGATAPTARYAFAPNAAAPAAGERPAQ